MILADLRSAARNLLANPGFAGVAIVVLALGIGATSAVFSIVNGVLLRPLPFANPDAIVQLGGRMTRDSAEQDWPLSPLDIESARQADQAFAAVAIVSNLRSFNASTADAIEHLRGELVSGDYFRVYGLSPAAGRLFTEAESRAPGAAQVVVISYDLWQRRFGGDASLIDRSITLNDQPFRVIGVLPAGFHGTSDEASLWAPIGLAAQMYNQPAYLEMRQFRWVGGVARLKAGVSPAAAQEIVNAHSRAMVEQFPASNQGLRIGLTPLADAVRGDLRAPLLALLAASAFVLLIACTNVANLLLARGSARERELAVRRALGAGTGAIMRLVVTETLLLGLIGGAAGLLLATWLVRLLLRFGALDVATFIGLGLDLRVVALTLGISLLSALGFGLAPAILAARVAPADVLRASGRGATGGKGRRRFQSGLIAAEVALALVLLVGAGLTTKGFGQFMSRDLGFATEGVLTMRMDFSASRYAQNEPMVLALNGVLERARAVPGVVSAAIEGPSYPTFGPYLINLDRADRPVEPGQSAQARRHNVSPGYFATLRVPLLAGRDFGTGDVATSEKVAIVSEALARRLWPGEDPLGRVFIPNGNRDLPVTVVGVAGEVLHGGLGADDNLFPDLYVAAAQFPPRNPALAALVVRTDGDPRVLVDPLREAISAAAPGIAPFSIGTIDEHLGEQNAAGRFLVFLMKAFAGMALLLAAVGIYGVIAYTVQQRTREIGVRIALGARQSGVLALMLRRALTPVVIGVVAGGAAAALLARVARSLLYGLSPNDPAVFALMALVLAAAAALAGLLPALRATRVDPIIAFREEG